MCRFIPRSRFDYCVNTLDKVGWHLRDKVIDLADKRWNEEREEAVRQSLLPLMRLSSSEGMGWEYPLTDTPVVEHMFIYSKCAEKRGWDMLVNRQSTLIWVMRCFTFCSENGDMTLIWIQLKANSWLSLEVVCPCVIMMCWQVGSASLWRKAADRGEAMTDLVNTNALATSHQWVAEPLKVYDRPKSLQACKHSQRLDTNVHISCNLFSAWTLYATKMDARTRTTLEDPSRAIRSFKEVANGWQ